jgi:hypothetical protein
MNFEYPTFSLKILFLGIYNTYRLAIIAVKGLLGLLFSGAFRFYKETIVLLNSKLEKDGKKLDKAQEKRILTYSIVGVVMFNSALKTLTGKKLDKKQQEISQSFTVLTAIFDDLVDEFNYSDEELKAVCQSKVQHADNAWEQMTIALIEKIERLNERTIWHPLTEKIVDYQILSKKQEHGKLEENFLREIIYNKGGISIQLNHDTVIEGKVNKTESEGFFGLGVIIQLTNDIYDIFKDRNNGTQTLVTDCKDIRILRKEYNEVVAKTFAIFKELPYPKKNIHDFLLQMMVIVSRAWVALDHLEEAQKTTQNIFSPQEYTRKQLITDMAKFRKIWRSFVYNVTAV